MRHVENPTIYSTIRALELGAPPAEVFGAALVRAQSAESSGAFISLAPEGGYPLPVDGPLAGVPFAVKDNIDTKDLPTTAGTNPLRGSVPHADAPTVATLRYTGAALIGKTNLHELASGVTSNNHALRSVRNPQEPSRSAGGSSGGSAVAVALGIVPFALGTDTGGSIRIPAAYCNVVGFRPSTGRWGAEGVVPLSGTRDTVGVIANTIADIELIDRIITGALPVSHPPMRLHGVRIGVPRRGFYEDVDPGVTAKTEAALSALEVEGAILVDVDLSRAQEIDRRCGLPLVLYETAMVLPRYLRSLPLPYGNLSLAELTAGVASPDVREIMDMVSSRTVSSADYATCLRLRREVQDIYSEVFSGHDLAAVIYPTVPMAPPPLGDDDITIHNGHEVEVFPTTTRNTGPGSLAGLPSVSIPVALEEVWPPAGLGLEGPAGEDRVLLELAAAIEDVIS